MTSAVTTPLLLEGHWTSESAGEGHVVFNAEGIHCGNCARAIQRALDELPGVIRADVNVVNSRVSVTWDPTKASLGTILGKVASTGFRPVPLVGESAVAAQRNERRDAQKRIGLAGLASMQLMMYAGGLYAGAFDGIDPHWADILRIACLIIATPVLFYSGAPILAGAIADLRRRVLGMDITVSLALVLAYAASVLNTFRGSGEVYFDSVAMFIFFLLLGRYAEMRGRHQASNVTDALAQALPADVQRIDPATGAALRTPLAAVRLGDRLRVGSGQVIPVDGSVLEGTALVDESLLTGESAPHRRAVGDLVLGGSINAGATLNMIVTRAADQ
jgi:Cu2+-exporting ATPase